MLKGVQTRMIYARKFLGQIKKGPHNSKDNIEVGFYIRSATEGEQSIIATIRWSCGV